MDRSCNYDKPPNFVNNVESKVRKVIKMVPKPKETLPGTSPNETITETFTALFPFVSPSPFGTKI